MTSYPLVSVLMPVYNCELYVAEAIDSILNQNYLNFEFIIIDDASTDTTVSIIQKYSDPRIKLIEKPKNTGLTNSLNHGLTLAKGVYIARMDGDDISLPERFEKQVAFMNEHTDVVTLGTNYSIIGTGKIKREPTTHEEIKVAFLYGSCIAHPTVMMRKSILIEFNINYDITSEPAEDYDLWVRLLQYGRLHNLSDVLLKYRLHPNQVSKKRSIVQQRSGIKTKFILLNYLNIHFDLKEKEILEKIFFSIKLEKQILDFDEIIFFITKIKQKLIAANASGFFNKKGFDEYLHYLQNTIISDYFLFREKFQPVTFKQYLILKKKYKFNFSFEKEIKLLIKSIVFYKQNISSSSS